MLLNEPIAKLRTLSATLLAADGVTLLPLATSWLAGMVKVSRNGAAFIDAVNLPVAVTGGGDGAFDFEVALSEVSTPGSIRVRFFDTVDGNLIAEYTDEIEATADDEYIRQNETIASERVLDATIYDELGELLASDTTWSAGMVKVSKAGAAFENADALPVALAGDGAFRLQFSIGEVDTVGNLRVRFYTAGGTLIGEFIALVRALPTQATPPLTFPDFVLVSLECECLFIEEGERMRKITRRQGDRLPPIQAIVFDEGQRADLTVFETITFRMVSGATEIEGAATGDVDGNLTYSFADGDTDTLGTFEAVFIGETSDGLVQTIPTRENLTIEVIASP